MDAPAQCFERLQVIQDPEPRSGADNMALDEALLGGSSGVALLRLYRWAEPTVSFGYFGTVLSARGVAQGRTVVRRWTGGGIVEHGEDFTYSLCIPSACDFVTLRSVESYRRIHTAVAHALLLSGSPAVSHDGQTTALSPTARENVCFERPVPHDLISHGKKVAGGAQRRSRSGLLHQGSIRLALPDLAGETAWRNSMRHELPACLGNFCEERSLAADEISQALALASAKYATAAWTNRR